jgi:hypothetical protein
MTSDLDADPLRPENPFAEPVWPEQEDTEMSWRETELYQKWADAVLNGIPNDFFVVVSASSRTGVSGSGKTTVETKLAKEFDRDETRDEGDPWGAEEKGTVDAKEFAYEISPNAPFGSAICYDEAQGLPGSEGSVNSKRSLNQEALDTVGSILGNRDEQYTVILGIQRLDMLNKDLIPLIDAWLLITKDPDHPNGPELVHHDVTVDDYAIDGFNLRTKAIERLSWPKVPHDDPDYQAMEEKKQRAKRRRTQERVEDAEEVRGPSDIAQEIIRGDAVDAYILGPEGGEYLSADLLEDDYDLTQNEAKKVKAHLKREADINVM